MFYKRSGDKKEVAILTVYVDDIILTGEDNAELESPNKELAAEYEIEDLGTVKYFLRMEFARSKEGVFVNQSKYTFDLMKQVCFDARKLSQPLKLT